jgi:hypothetical protein
MLYAESSAESTLQQSKVEPGQGAFGVQPFAFILSFYLKKNTAN